MKTEDLSLGEPGTEQFKVIVHIDDVLLKSEKIHDPFITNTTIISRWDLLGAFLRGRLKITVRVLGEAQIVDRMMNMNPISNAEPVATLASALDSFLPEKKA